MSGMASPQTSYKFTKRCPEVKREDVVVETTMMAEILSGMIITCMQIPASCAYAGLGNVPPTMGLTSAWIIGLCGALFQGAPGSISGATAAAGSVMSIYITDNLNDGEKQEQKQIIVIATMMSSVWWFVAAYFRVGRFLQLIPTTVMIGFANGLGMTIGWAQVKPFFRTGEGESLGWMIVILIVSMCIMYTLPYYTKRIPPALVAIVTVTVLEQLLLRRYLHVQTPTIEGLLGGARMDELPTPFWMSKSWNSTLVAKRPYLFHEVVEISTQLTFSGVVESVMTAKVIAEMTGIPSNYERHLCALGLGNFFAGLFGAMGGNTLSSLSLMNVRNGGQGFPSQFTAVVSFLISLFVLGKLMVLIPVAGLHGIMLMVVYNMIKWFSARLVICSLLPVRFLKLDWMQKYKIKYGDAVVILVVTVCINLLSLVMGFLIGLALAALIYAWNSLHRIEVRAATHSDRKVYVITGHLFFGACGMFEKYFDVAGDPSDVEVQLENADLFDYSAMEALSNLIAQYKSKGKTLKLMNMGGESNRLVDEFGASHANLSLHVIQCPKVKGWHATVEDPHCDEATPQEQLVQFRGRSRLESYDSWNHFVTTMAPTMTRGVSKESSGWSGRSPAPPPPTPTGETLELARVKLKESLEAAARSSWNEAL